MKENNKEVKKETKPSKDPMDVLREYEEYLMKFAGKDGHNPFVKVNQIIRPLQERILKGEDVSAEIAKIKHEPPKV